ncbi:hypothetical protein VKT23_008983 [Stygiomarasmius scandens]|uniref:Ricin B lectin domain-containing protein n=1 Tax=Marasmiellus scandens TaxID=2682957 RepID=A0ABR1JIG3_9AGAR
MSFRVAALSLLALAASSTVVAQNTCTPGPSTSGSIVNSGNANLEWGVPSAAPSTAVVSSSFRGLSAQDWKIELNGDFAPVFIIRDISNNDLVISSPNGNDLELQTADGEFGGSVAQTWLIRCNTCDADGLAGDGCVFEALGPEQNRCAEIGDSAGAPLTITNCDGSEKQSFAIIA